MVEFSLFYCAFYVMFILFCSFYVDLCSMLNSVVLYDKQHNQQVIHGESLQIKNTMRK